MQASDCAHEMNRMALQLVQGLPWWCDVPQSLIATTPTPAMKVVCTEESNASAPLQPAGFLHSSSDQAPSVVLTQAPTDVPNTQLTSSRIPSSSGNEDNQHLPLTTGLGILQPQGDYTPPHTRVEHGQSMVAGPHPYADPYLGGMVAACGAHVMIPPLILGIQQARMPLPSEITEEEPVYVNAKQYNGILRRRQCRARAESENKLVKTRKPYLHESRHLHAMRRARGCGGRFLNTKDKDSTKTNVKGKMSEEQVFEGMQDLRGHLMVHMGQSLGGDNGHCSGMLVQNDHSIMSSGISFGT